MVGTAVSVRRIAMAGEYDLGLQRPGSGEGRVEVVNLEPDENPVTIGFVLGITDRAVVMRHLEPVQLKYELVIHHQSLVLRPAVRALTAQEVLVPPAAGFDVADRDQWLGAHTVSRRVGLYSDARSAATFSSSDSRL
jgi:hypothetical protein